MRHMQRKNRIALLITTLLLCASVDSLTAQNPQSMAKPEDLGLLIPKGPRPIAGDDRRVLVQLSDDTGADPVVCKIYLEVGDRYIVKLPNGALRSYKIAETVKTDRPFEAAEKDELSKELLKQFPGFKTRATRRYLCVYNTSDAFCERQTAILETMYPNLEKFFQRKKLEPEKPETRLVVVMFRTKTQFLKYRAMPESLLAYYNAVDNRVFLYQYSDLATDAPVIAAMQATSTIAHEGVHQILHNIGVQRRLSDWPLWISEGLAEYFAPTTSAARSKWRGVGKPNQLRMRELFRHIKQRDGIGSGAMVRNVITTERLDSTGYAVAWSLVHYLMTKHGDEFFEYLREVRDIKPLSDSGDELIRFVKHFGTDFSSIERGMIKHIRSLPYVDPVINQPYYLVTARTGSRKYATVTSSRDLRSVKRGMLKKMSVNERPKAAFNVTTFPNRIMAQQAMNMFSK